MLFVCIHGYSFYWISIFSVGCYVKINVYEGQTLPTKPWNHKNCRLYSVEKTIIHHITCMQPLNSHKTLLKK